MDGTAVGAMFRQGDGGFLCARWGRAQVPVAFGVDDTTLAALRAGFETVAQAAGRRLGQADPETGANVLMFFCREWEELDTIPDLDRLLGGAGLVARLQGAGANQYRSLRFDARGAIRAAFAFLRMDAHLAALPADTLALREAALVALSWGPGAFANAPPVAEAQGRAVLRPEIAALIRAAHAPELPDAATDPSHALRLSARMEARP